VSVGEWLLLSALAWAVAAYLIVPRLWKVYFRYHPLVAEVGVTT